MLNLKSDKNTAFISLVGSHNYNLQNETSDKDYKHFVFPTFKNLYNEDLKSKSTVSDKYDQEIHDIRKLPKMLYKSNINFIEVLFSQEVESCSGLYSELHSIREDIARMNLSYLYDACVGMFYGKVKDYHNQKNKNWLKACKSAMTAQRIQIFLDRYAKDEFSSFAKAIYFDDNDKTDSLMKSYLLKIKSGVSSVEDTDRVIDSLYHWIKDEFLEHKYKSKPVDNDTYEKIQEIVYDYCYSRIRQELG